MALFNAGYPATYQNPYMYQPIQYQQPQPQAQQQNGFVRVQNENEARMYPVAPGNSVTFINENAPYCYTKSVDMSQLDRPKFEKYRLVKEEDIAIQEQSKQSTSIYAIKSDVDAEIQKIKEQLNVLSSKVYAEEKTTND